MSFSHVVRENSSGNVSIVLLEEDYAFTGPDTLPTFVPDIYSGLRTTLNPAARYALASLLMVVIVFTILGNSLTIVAVCTQRRLQTVGNTYITSLACADLVVSCLVMSVLWLTTVLYESWFLPKWLCPVWTFVEYVSFTASLTNVALIAWDRYNTVAYPLKALRKRTKQRAAWYVLAAWGCPTVFWAFIITLVWLLNGPSPIGTCFLVWRQGSLVIVTASIAIYLPILAIILLFTAMMYHLQGHMAKMNDRMRRSVSKKEDGAGFEQSIDTQHMISEEPLRDSKPPQESSLLLSSTAMSISALSLDALSSFSYYDEAMTSFRSLESIPKEVSVESKTVGTSTSPERFGLVRSIGVNTSAPAYNPQIPDVANVGLQRRSFTRDTYHRGIKRISCRRDVYRKRYLHVDPTVWLPANRGSSLESDRSTSMDSDDGPRGAEARRGQMSAQNSTSSTKSDEKSVGNGPHNVNANAIVSNNVNANANVSHNVTNNANGSGNANATNKANVTPNVTSNVSANGNGNGPLPSSAAEPIPPPPPAAGTAPPPAAVEPVVKIKLGEIGRQQSVDVDNLTQNNGRTMRRRYYSKLANFGQSGSSESDTSQKSYLKPRIKLDEADRSMSDESNESTEQSRFLQVKPCLKTTSTSTDTPTKKRSLNLPPLKQERSVSEDSTESNRFLRVAKKLGDIGRTSSNESTDSRYLRVEPRVRFAHLGHSLSIDSADNISVISCTSQNTNGSRRGSRRSSQKSHHAHNGRKEMTAAMKRERYASLMRRERQTTLRQCRLRQQMRAAKTLGLIAGFLLLCWLPFAVMWPWKTYCPTCLSTRIFDIAKWATSLNSAINPIIYCMCNPQFRRAFRKIICRFRKDRTNN